MCSPSGMWMAAAWLLCGATRRQLLARAASIFACIPPTAASVSPGASAPVIAQRGRNPRKAAWTAAHGRAARRSPPEMLTQGDRKGCAERSADDEQDGSLIAKGEPPHDAAVHTLAADRIGPGLDQGGGEFLAGVDGTHGLGSGSSPGGPPANSQISSIPVAPPALSGLSNSTGTRVTPPRRGSTPASRNAVSNAIAHDGPAPWLSGSSASALASSLASTRMGSRSDGSMAERHWSDSSGPVAGGLGRSSPEQPSNVLRPAGLPGVLRRNRRGRG